MATVWIPSLLRDLTQGIEKIEVQGKTVAEILGGLDRRFPGIRNRLCDGSGLRKGFTVAIDTQIARLGLSEPVGEQSEIHFIPAISGGSGHAATP